MRFPHFRETLSRPPDEKDQSEFIKMKLKSKLFLLTGSGFVLFTVLLSLVCILILLHFTRAESERLLLKEADRIATELDALQDYTYKEVDFDSLNRKELNEYLFRKYEKYSFDRASTLHSAEQHIDAFLFRRQNALPSK